MSINLASVKAILFDFDGVLGNSIEDNRKAWSYAFSKYELQFDELKYYLLEGKKSDEIIMGLLTEIGVADRVNYKEILAIKSEYYKNNNSFAYYPGTKELLLKLENKKIKHGVVSGGSKKRINSFPSNALIQHMEVIISGEDVENSKPNPEPYLKAANELNIDPRECLVIENAPLGITAAKKAKMQCIALCTTLESSYLNQADLILPDMHTLYSFLEPILDN